MSDPIRKPSDKNTSDDLQNQADERVVASRAVALLAARAALDKKALGVEIIDVVGKVDYADFLVLMNGTSDRHCSALARGVEEVLGKSGHKPLAVEGLGQADWVLLDFFDVVVHVFSDDARDLYDLAGLWMDASRVPVPERSTSRETDAGAGRTSHGRTSPDDSEPSDPQQD